MHFLFIPNLFLSLLCQESKVYNYHDTKQDPVNSKDLKVMFSDVT